MVDNLRVDCLTVLSLGAGVQSTTLALLAVDGTLSPKPDAAIFADTGWEPKRVYRHFAKLRPVLEDAGIAVRMVSKGNLRDETLSPDFGIPMPLFVLDDQDSRGMLTRQCTSIYKLEPINAEIRRMLGGKRRTKPCNRCGGRGQRVTPWSIKGGEPRYGMCSVCRGTGKIVSVGSPPKTRRAVQWIGFSTDEIERVASSRVPYARNVFPLLDLEWSRADCETYLRERGWDAAKSACIGCPYHGNHQWRQLRDEQPEEWEDAVAFDQAVRDMRQVTGGAALVGSGYLHAARVPLSIAPIDHSANDREEYGAPNSCSPHGCRSGSID